MVECNFKATASVKDIVTGIRRTYCQLSKLYDCEEEKCIFQQILSHVKPLPSDVMEDMEHLAKKTSKGK